MADPKGFMKHPREDVPLRPVEERRRDWREVHGRLPEDRLRAQASRCMDCGVPFCHPACPLGNLIPDFNDLVREGRWGEASDRLHATNSFPELTGRLCPAPCEAACVLGIDQDPVTIEQVEERIAEEAFARGWISPRPPAHRSGRSVAVVGSGPAGLAAAQQLNRAGHRVTVFERSDRPGGICRYGIPDFKLDRAVLDRRIAQIEAEGVVFRTGTDAARDPGVAALRARFDAVLLAIGAGQPRELPVPGRDLRGVHLAMEHLEQQNRFNAGSPSPEAGRVDAAGRRVVILGGGDTGADCLGTALRQGAASVVQIEILPRPPDRRPPSTPWPRWPASLRTSPAHHEGGRREWGLRTLELTGERGRVVGVRAIRDADWREHFFEADLVLLALGFTGPVQAGIVEDLGVKLDARGRIRADDRFGTSVRGVFAAGDARRGASLIVWAISEGRQAARAIDEFLRGESRLPLAGASMEWGSEP